MIGSFLPPTDGDKATWLSHFANRLPQYSTALDLSSGAISQAEDDAACFSYAVLMQDAAKQYWVSFSNLKKRLLHSPVQTLTGVFPQPIDLGMEPLMVPDGIFDRVTALVSTIKMHPNYTVAIGQDLGIIPPPVVPVNPATMQPVLTVKLEGGYPLLKWKKGDSDGVHIYVDRNDGNGMVLMKRTVKTECIDAHPLPPNTVSASWGYQIIYLLEDDEVGLRSAIITVNVLRAGS